MLFRDAPPLTRAVVLRAIGFAVAVVLGAIAIWMIVTGTDQKGIKIGFLAGLWGVLLGAYAMFGSRRPGEDADARTEVPVLTSTDVELRSTGEVERVAEAAARRAFEERLQAMIRTELATAMTREVSDLRAEIARLRGDLLEKVGGQLRLERIETTRLIGSDLEALQHEVRQLKAASESGTLMAELGLEERSVHRIVEPTAASETVRTVTEVKPRPSLHKSDRAEEKAEKAARKRAAAEKAEAERAAVQRAEAERVAAERAAADKAEREQARRERLAAEQAAAEKAERERIAAEKAAEKAERERIAAEKAAQQAERERIATEKAATEKAAAEQAAAESAATIKAERERTSAEDAAADKARAAINPSGGPERTPWFPPMAPQRTSARPTPAETTGPVRPAAGDATRETGRGNWTPPAPRPAPQPAADKDPFADLPRLTPFTEFELDPIETRPAPTPNGYTGRRRASADEVEDAGETESGRHVGPDSPTESDDRSSRRHRRAEEDSEANELLARLLARESAPR